MTGSKPRLGIPYLPPDRYADLVNEAAVAAVELGWTWMEASRSYSVIVLRPDGSNGAGGRIAGQVIGNGEGWW